MNKFQNVYSNGDAGHVTFIGLCEVGDKCKECSFSVGFVFGLSALGSRLQVGGPVTEYFLFQIFGSGTKKYAAWPCLSLPISPEALTDL